MSLFTEILGRNLPTVFFTVFLLIVASGGFSYGAYLAGQRQYQVPYKYFIGAYLGSMAFVLLLARGFVAIFGG